MKNKSGCLIRLLVTSGAIAALAVTILCVLAFLLLRLEEEASSKFEPPMVIVSVPDESSEWAQVGSNLPVSAMAMGAQPILHVELWVDGQLRETRASNKIGGESPLTAQFSVMMAEGSHMIFVRAIDAVGLVGQSPPLDLMTIQPLRVSAGETWMGIANATGVDPMTLQELNPTVLTPEPEPGTEIIVPTTPPGGALPGPGAPPVPPGGAPPGPGGAPVPPGGAPPGPGGPPVPPGGAPPGPGGPSAPPGGVPNKPALKGKSQTILGILDLKALASLLSGKPPAAPSNLQAEVENCRLTLIWDDNADNETSYVVWLAGKGLAPRVLTTLEPGEGGTVWVWMHTPIKDGSYSVWVEAVNSFGKKPSNIVWVQIKENCLSSQATQLRLVFYTLTTSAKYDKVYCYGSFEAAPEVRVPKGSVFYTPSQVKNQTVYSTAYSAMHLDTSIPNDNSLEIVTKCMGWAGGKLSSLGVAKGAYPAESWNGVRQVLNGPSYQFTLAIWRGLYGSFGILAQAPAGYAEVVLTNKSQAKVQKISMRESGGIWSISPVDVAPGGTYRWKWSQHGKYDLRALGNGDIVLDERLNVNITGTYYWTIASTKATLTLSNSSGALIQTVYFRPAGQSAWGNNRLNAGESIGYLGATTRSWEIPTGDYDLRATRCEGLVVDEKLNVTVKGTYNWNVIAALDVHNDTPYWMNELAVWQQSDETKPGFKPLDVLAQTGRLKPWGVIRVNLSAGNYQLRATYPLGIGTIKGCPLGVCPPAPKAGKSGGGTDVNCFWSNVKGNTAWFVGSGYLIYEKSTAAIQVKCK